MNKKYIFLILFMQCCFTLMFSQTLPQPQNNQLYTEFTSYRTALYLKKPLVSSGYLIMDGLDRFLFIQTKPVYIEVRKISDKITFKKGDMQPIQVDAMSDGIIFIFTDSAKLKEKYTIIKKDINNKQEYLIIPKEKENISQILIIAIHDKIEKMKIFFNDKSNLVYEFKNTVTGIKPDEKYF